MGKTDAGLFSLTSVFALVAKFLKLAEFDLKFCWKCFTDDTWRELASLTHDDSLDLTRTLATADLNMLWVKKMEGLAAVICRPEAATPTILNMRTAETT